MLLTVRSAVFTALLFAAISFVFPRYFNGPYPHPPGPIFDKEANRFYLHEIERVQPEVILLGDSILTKDVDLAGFQDQTGLHTYKLDLPGSSSALWYLILAYDIVPAQPAPRTVVLLFRDTILTAPTFRTTGPYFGLIDKYAPPRNTLLIERAFLSTLTPPQLVLERYFPLYTYRGEVRESIDSGLRYGVPAALDCDRECVDPLVTHLLNDIPEESKSEAIVQAEQPLYSDQELDFYAQVERSFLPEMIRLAQQDGIQLVLVRAPTRVFRSQEAEPAGLDTYLAGLRAYLAQHGIAYLDLAWPEAIGLDNFTDPHHMDTEGKALFTKIFVAELAPYLK